MFVNAHSCPSYIGRRRMKPKNEQYLKGTKKLVHPDYTYWTLGYLLSARGARKLMAAKPLNKLMAVDEFLSVMFDKTPQ